MNLRYTGTLIIITSFSKMPSKDLDQSQWEEDTHRELYWRQRLGACHGSTVFICIDLRLGIIFSFFFLYTGSPNENLKKVIFRFTCNLLCLHLQEVFPESLAVAGVKRCHSRLSESCISGSSVSKYKSFPELLLSLPFGNCKQCDRSFRFQCD